MIWGKIITWDIICTYKQFKNCPGVAENPNVTWQIICDTPNYSWNDNHLSVNPNLTWKIVRDYPRDWNFGWMSFNTFGK